MQLHLANISVLYHDVSYYGAVLPRRRPHHVLILSVHLSVRLSVLCLLLFTYRFRYVSLN